MQKSDDNYWELVLAFHYQGSGDPSQVIRLGSKCHLTQPFINSPPSQYTFVEHLPRGPILGNSVLLAICYFFLSLDTWEDGSPFSEFRGLGWNTLFLLACHPEVQDKTLFLL